MQSAPFPPSLGEVTSEWLTLVLASSGALRAGRVEALERRASCGNWSNIAHLTPRYSRDAQGEQPARLLIKLCTGAHAVFGRSEVLYYQRDYASYALAPLPRCYGAAYADETRSYWLLLEDVSDTHAGDHPPSAAYASALGTAAALLHARYWGTDALREIGEQPAGEAEIERYFAHVSRGLAPLFEVLGGALPPERRALLVELFAERPRALLARAADHAGMTLVHGDLNPSNVLAPRAGSWPVYLIDRQPFDWSLRVWLGVSDLAYAMVLFWSPDERRTYQYDALRAYERTLREQGCEYAWARILDDYRFAVAQCVEHAVEWLVLPEDRVARRWLWSLQLDRALEAFTELGCAALHP